MKFAIFIMIFIALPPCISAEDFSAADKELNQVYQEVLRRYADDQDFVKKFRTAQQAWLKFRDAHLEALFPASSKRGEYGSAYPMCSGIALAELTKARTAQLRAWIEGVEEGEVCAGSIKRKAKD